LGFFAIVALLVGGVVVVGLAFNGEVGGAGGSGAAIEDGKVYFGANPEFPKVAVGKVVVAIAGAEEFKGDLGTAAIVGVEGLQVQFEQFPHAGFVAVDDGAVVEAGGGHGIGLEVAVQWAKRRGVVMKIQYFRETDTLAIELSDRAVVETEAITEDLILDYDDQGKIVAITLDNYWKNVDTDSFQTSKV